MKIVTTKKREINTSDANWVMSIFKYRQEKREMGRTKEFLAWHNYMVHALDVQICAAQQAI